MLKQIGGITFYTNDEPTKEEWQHTPDAEIVPGWLLAATAFAIFVLFVILVHAHAFTPLFK